MSEDTTRKLPDALSFEDRVLDELRQLNLRLTAVEERVEWRLMETRPIWEAVQTQLIRLEGKFDDFDNKIDELGLDMLELRGQQRGLHKRVTVLEQAPRPPQA